MSNTISFCLMNDNKISILLPMLFIGFLLAGCDKTDNSKKQNPLGLSTVKKMTKPVSLSGVVNDEDGPVAAGKIVIVDEKGNTILETQWNKGAYSVLIPAGTSLPIVLNAYPESASSEQAALRVAVINTALKKYDISPLTTAITKQAEVLGGYTYANLQQAAMTSTTTPDANKTTGGFRGDPTKQYGGWH